MGDVTAVLNSAGDVVAEYQYDAYGNVMSATGPLAELNPLRYRGYYYDSETGYYYLQSRYYVPEWGRFLNAAVLFIAGDALTGSNMYAYCNGNPVKYMDPSGMSVWSAIKNAANVVVNVVKAYVIEPINTYIVQPAVEVVEKYIVEPVKTYVIEPIRQIVTPMQPPPPPQIKIPEATKAVTSVAGTPGVTPVPGQIDFVNLFFSIIQRVWLSLIRYLMKLFSPQQSAYSIAGKTEEQNLTNDTAMLAQKGFGELGYSPSSYASIPSQTTIESIFSQATYIFLYVGHGSPTALFPNYGDIPFIVSSSDGMKEAPGRVNIEKYDLSKSKLHVYMGCNTSAGSTNICTDANTKSKVKCVIGWTETVDSGDAIAWLFYFLFGLKESWTIKQAADYADDYEEYQMKLLLKAG